MSKFIATIRTLIFVTFICLPLTVSASQGSGTGAHSQASNIGVGSISSGSFLSSQGSGTGTASQGSGTGTASQGSGTGTASQGSGTGADSVASFTWGTGYSAKNIQVYLQPVANLWNCITNMQCIFYAKE